MRLELERDRGGSLGGRYRKIRICRLLKNIEAVSHEIVPKLKIQNPRITF